MTTVQGPRPGWYPDPSGTAHRRWFDGVGWTVHCAPQSRRPLHWAIRLAIGCFAIACATFGGFVVYDTVRPVSSAHSNAPSIEAFYREIDADGFGNMRVGDAMDRGKRACKGDGLVLWGTADYSMADSFNFAAAAQQACSALRP